MSRECIESFVSIKKKEKKIDFYKFLAHGASLKGWFLEERSLNILTILVLFCFFILSCAKTWFARLTFAAATLIGDHLE